MSAQIKFKHYSEKIFFYLCFIIPAYLVFNSNIDQAREYINSNWLESIKGGDQYVIYLTLKAILFENQKPWGVESGWMPNAFISLVNIYHFFASFLQKRFDANLIQSGIFFSSLVASLSVIMMYRLAKHSKSKLKPNHLAFLSLLTFCTFFYTTGVLRFSYIPWMHYAASFIGLTFFWSAIEFFFTKSLKWLILFAFSLIYFFSIRQHEALVAIIALFISVILFAKIKLHFRVIKNNAFIFLCTCFCTMTLIYFTSNQTGWNGHYNAQRLQNSFVNEYLKFYPLFSPLRIFQTFIDANFYSYENNWPIRRIISGFSQADFGMPLIYQLSFLWFSLAATLFVLFKIKKKMELVFPLVFVGLFFIGLTFAYHSVPAWGSGHLRHGLIREFILSTVLLMSVLSVNLVHSKKDIVKYISCLILFPIIIGQYALPYLRPELKSFHLLKPTGEYSCIDGVCSVEISYLTKENKKINLPFNTSIILQYCSDGVSGKPLALGESGLSVHESVFKFQLESCPSPIQISIFPVLPGYTGSDPVLKWSVQN